MQVKRLALTNVRGFQRAEFDFQPGINLLVGVNGAGKSTVLDVLRIMFSRYLGDFTPSQATRMKFRSEDNRYGQGEDPHTLEVELDFTIGNYPVKETAAFNRFKIKPSADIIAREYKNASQSLAVYFSTRRSITSFSLAGTGISSEMLKAKGTPTRYIPDMVRPYLAHDEALESRELRLSAFAEWWTARQVLGFEDARLSEILTHIEAAITTFLPDYHALRNYTDRKRATLLLDKQDTTLDIQQLSDGERSIIALVFDLARRLALANPNHSDPMKEAEAVVLIDELDLHLHPAWQRTICDRLTNTFPKCQFIATTHSPQIIGEVVGDRVSFIKNGEVSRALQSFGMDANWILQHLMNTPSTDIDIHNDTLRIEALIEAEKYDEAIGLIEKLRVQKRGDSPDLAALQAQIDMMLFLEDDDNESAPE